MHVRCLRVQAWDPILIICQIIALQCLFYLTIGLAQAIFLGICIHGMQLG